MRPTDQIRSQAASRRLGAALPLALALAITACGGDEGAGSAALAVPPPGKCLESWNAETASTKFGRHVYTEHAGRQGRLAILETGPGAVNIKSKRTCAMIFAVPETDEEYGDVGLVETRFGWASMTELARTDPDYLDQIQREAADAPNVNLFPDGEIAAA